MKVTFSENIGSTPAIVRRDTGEIFLNSKIWFTLPQAYRRFILFHEVGHYTLQTTNELEADHYAFNQIAGTQKESLKNTVRTLYGVLPFNTELQGCRLQNMYRLALTYDQQKNPTTARRNEIRRIETDLNRHYSNNQQYQEYMNTRKGKSTDYEFPGYEAAQFDPSVGQWFKDIPTLTSSPAVIAEPVQETPWPTGTPDFVRPFETSTTVSPVPVAMINRVSPAPVTVPLSLIPEYQIPFEIDWKSVSIGILVILAIIGLNKI